MVADGGLYPELVPLKKVVQQGRFMADAIVSGCV